MDKICYPSGISVVAVQNYGCSGTLFLQSLLDGHPNVLMTPALYSHGFYHFWEAHGNKSITEVIKSFVTWHSNWFHPGGAARDHGLHQMGEGMNEALYIKPELFVEALSELLLHQCRPAYSARKNFFVAVYLAYAYALGRTVSEPAVIVFPIHSLPSKHTGYLLDDFPDAKFIHLVRDPIQNIGSMVKHITHNKLPVNPLECSLAQIICDYTKHWGRGYYAGGDKPFSNEVRGASRAVKLEDIHKNHRETLSTICDWLNIPWDDRLMESTFDVKRWWNRPESPRVSGSDAKIISSDRYGELFSGFDKARLYCVLNGKYRKWSYSIPAYACNILVRGIALLLLPAPFRLERKLWYGNSVRVSLLERIAADKCSFSKNILNAANKLLDMKKIKDLMDGYKSSSTGIKSRLLKLYALTGLHVAAAAMIFRDNINSSSSENKEIPPGISSSQNTAAQYLHKFLNAGLRSVLLLYLVMTDYVMIRKWLFKGWLDQWKSERPEVDMLVREESEREEIKILSEERKASACNTEPFTG